ncbi:alpha/beta hydrolase [Anaerocolumna sp. AGMB13020]|uniref:alpha/beta fold hydrolase n=1 Tax=Anaerocolumna sp. AGMB13020 TaxID=3081750 RepID=UPI00295296D0|nr:alpha/beta hydrolase [Anaerocolumna sp. AGMB13020]WOO35271.1 alpha/beta hydrolase [Anaerocolumna sp. AGMB13020]
MGISKYRKNKKHKIIFLLAFIIVAGGIWQIIMERYEADRYLPTGKIITVNSHKMHTYSLGNGKDTLVFIAGSGTTSAYTDFYYMQQELSAYAKTFSYDHAGLGWSEGTDIPRTIDNVTAELHELLRETGHAAPYVLVAHSLGSLEAIRYAQRYQGEVKGIIFLDGGSPEYYADYPEWNSMLLNRTSAVLRLTGINRLLGNFGLMLPFVGEDTRNHLLPEDIKKIDAAMYYNKLGSSENLKGLGLINENAKTVIRHGYLEDIPLLALSAKNDDKWTKAQEELLNWSDRSSGMVMKESKHYLHWTNKNSVIATISEFINTYGD